jgi:predicted amidohydrolase YtcJ
MNRKLLLSLLLVSLILNNCGQEETSPTSQTSELAITPTITSSQTQEFQTPVVVDSGVYTSIQWNQDEVEDKLFLISEGDVDTEIVSVGNPPLEARRTGNGQALPSPGGDNVVDNYIEFRVDDSVIFAGSPTTLVLIEVEYFDQGMDNFTIEYDAISGGPYGDGTFKETDPVIKTDSQIFQTAVFTLSDAYFANRDNGADFRIADKNDGAEIIRSVTVTLLKESSVTADIIFYNGQVVTIDPRMPQAQALAIKDETILAVGSNEDILALQDPGTQVIDLNGRPLLPGFIEGHSHILKFPDRAGLTLDEAMEVALSFGFTTLNELVGETDFIDDLILADQEDRLRLRVNVFTNFNYGFLDEDGNTIFVDPPWSRDNLPILDSDFRLRVPGIKVFVDGAFSGNRGCFALTDPYPDSLQAEGYFQEICHSPRGDLYLTQTEINQIVAEAQATGFQVAFHAMGDRAIDQALDAIEYALNGEPNENYRHTIHHSALLRPDQLERFSELGIIASVRGYFNTCDQDYYPDYYGAERYAWSANRYALPSLDIHAFNESDFGWTVEYNDRTSPRNIDPLINLYGLVTRRQLRTDGTECEPLNWLIPHAISVEQGLRMITIEPAYAVSQEDYIGSLEPGKFADLIILSGNPLTIDPNDIKNLEVWMTMVAGQTEYCAPGHEDICP